MLTAAGGDGLSVDGKPFAGTVRLGAGTGPAGASRAALGGRRLVVLVREEVWDVRRFGPDAEARRRSAGIEATPHEDRWSVPARFTPYAEDRVVRVPNADGRERGLGLGGEAVFTLDGREHGLRVAVQGDGSLWAVCADAGRGVSSHRFRFLYPEAPDAEGRTARSASTGPSCRRAPSPTPSPTPSSARSRRRGTRCRWRSGRGSAPCADLPPALRRARAEPAPSPRPRRADRASARRGQAPAPVPVPEAGGRKVPLRLPAVRPNTPPQRLSGSRHVRNPGEPAVLAAPHGPRPHAGPRIPLGGNDT